MTKKVSKKRLDCEGNLKEDLLKDYVCFLLTLLLLIVFPNDAQELIEYTFIATILSPFSYVLGRIFCVIKEKLQKRGKTINQAERSVKILIISLFFIYILMLPIHGIIILYLFENREKLLNSDEKEIKKFLIKNIIITICCAVLCRFLQGGKYEYTSYIFVGILLFFPIEKTYKFLKHKKEMK